MIRKARSQTINGIRLYERLTDGVVTCKTLGGTCWEEFRGVGAWEQAEEWASKTLDFTVVGDKQHLASK